MENTTITKRTPHLDGIRGIAALSVVLFHFARAFDNSAISYIHIVNRTFVSTLWNGHFAVAIFFVLSGYLFFKKFYSSTLLKGLEAGAKRFLRLSVPILFVCLTAYVLHKLNLFTNKTAALSNGSDWLGIWYKFDPSLSLAFTESFWKDFVSFNPLYTYNSNLWTISYELFAVLVVITSAIFCKLLNNVFQLVLLVSIAALCYGTHYFEFMLGALMALLLLIKDVNIPLEVAFIILIMSMSMGSLVLPSQFMPLWSDLFYPIAATLLIATVSKNKTLAKIFSNRVFIKLGELSFGLYLTHFLSLNSVASTTFLKTGSVKITFISYAISTMILSLAFTYAIDQPWIKFLNNIFSKKSFKPKQAIV